MVRVTPAGSDVTAANGEEKDDGNRWIVGADQTFRTPVS